MSTVTKRQLLDGTIRYRAQVRIKKKAIQVDVKMKYAL